MITSLSPLWTYAISLFLSFLDIKRKGAAKKASGDPKSEIYFYGLPPLSLCEGRREREKGVNFLSYRYKCECVQAVSKLPRRNKWLLSAKIPILLKLSICF